MSAQALKLYQSSVGKKVLMAVSGVIWVGFLVLHLYSNLHIFAGKDVLNNYYEALEESVVQLWGVRAVLLGSILVHVISAFSLVWQNKKARTKGYQVQNCTATTYAARTMRWSGPILLMYIVFHLSHFAGGLFQDSSLAEDDVYGRMVTSFSVAPISFFYMLAFVCLGVHVYHGAWSFFQSLGLYHNKYNPLKRTLAGLVTLLLIGGYLSIPVAVLLGIIK